MIKTIEFKVFEDNQCIIDLTTNAIYNNDEYTFFYDKSKIVISMLNNIIIKYTSEINQTIHFSKGNSYSILCLNNKEIRLNIKLLKYVRVDNSFDIKYSLVDDIESIHQVIFKCYE